MMSVAVVIDRYSGPPRLEAVDGDSLSIGDRVLDAHPFNSTRVFLPRGHAFELRHALIARDVLSTHQWRTCPLCGVGFDLVDVDVMRKTIGRHWIDAQLLELFDEVRCSDAYGYAITMSVRFAEAMTIAVGGGCHVTPVSACREAAIVTSVTADNIDALRMVCELEGGFDVRRYSAQHCVALLVKR